MRNGIFDDCAWWEWAETLPIDSAPSAEVLAEAERYAPRDRVCLPGWRGGGELAPVAALARAFAPHDARVARAQGLTVTHLVYLSASSLAEELASLGAGLVGAEITGAAVNRLETAESQALAALASYPLRELDLRGVPRAKDIEPVRPTLERLALMLQDKPRATELLEATWPSLRALRLSGGNAADMAALAALLPALPERLPACESLDLYETSTKNQVELFEAMVTSPWIARLSGLRVHDARAATDRLALLADVPFERLRYLGLGALQVRPQLADALARSTSLRTVESLEIAAKIGKAGLLRIVEAWPALREIAVWNAPGESVGDIVKAFGLEPFVARGGIVQRRLS